MENDDLKKHLDTIRALNEDINEFNSYETDLAFNKVQKRIDKTRYKRISLTFFSRAAAILILPLIIATSVLSYWYFTQNTKIQTYTKVPHYYNITAAPGTIAQLVLPDSSKVWLNSNSNLRYPADFIDGERQVWLQGEGYFEVESDLQNPFIVSLDEKVKVKAFGTKFNISSYQEDSCLETVLETGSVDVIINDKPITLKTSYLASYDRKNDQIRIQPANIYEKTAWKDGVLIFRNLDIEEALKKLSRRYNMDITLHNPSKKHYKVRATFTNETITQILNYLTMAIPMKWEISKPEQNKDDSFDRQNINIWLK